MTKFYSLLAAVALTATVNAQETVATYTVTGTNNVALADGTLNSNVTYTWGSGSNSNPPKYFTTGAAGRMYAKNTLTVVVPSNQVITKFEVLGAAGGDYLVSQYTIDGGAPATAPKTGTVDYTVVPATEGSTIVFTAGSNVTSGHSRFVSFKVTYKPKETMAVVDATKGKANLVKNTIVSNELIFGASAKVSVYNTAGQIVKTAEVSDNSRLDVSALPKGTYVVTGLVNGQAVSQKVIKK